ncbi:MAG: hypothetical protein V3R96_03955 [Dehalococcoidales bacterium]
MESIREAKPLLQVSLRGGVADVAIWDVGSAPSPTTQIASPSAFVGMVSQ